MRLLVTGGAGRLGVELVRTLAAEGYEARVLDLPQADHKALEGLDRVETLKGSITSAADVDRAVRGVQGVFHLAALLPPMSELDRDGTMRVNVEGTRNLTSAVRRTAGSVPIIFPSSVAAYGVTANERPPVTVDHPLRATDYYSGSKIEGEAIVRESGCPYATLRVSGIYGVEPAEPPKVIPFKRDQRVEFIDRRDVARALKAAYENPDAHGRTLNLAGGGSWQMTGAEFIEQLYAQFNFRPKLTFSPSYTWFDWYDTKETRRALRYQSVSFARFLKDLRKLAARMGLR